MPPPAKEPPRRPGRVAGQSGQCAHLAVDRQPSLALSLRPGLRRYAQRLRPQRLVTQPSRIARLAGRRAAGERPVVEGPAPADRHQRGLPPESANDPAAAKVDADNRLLWRQNRRKLEAETVRDSVLAASGTLVKTMGGPGFDLFRFKDDHSPVYDHSDPAKIDNPQVRRRTVYRFTVRSVPNPFLEALNSPTPT